MGLFNFLKGNERKNNESENKVEKELYYGDLAKTKILRELFNIPTEQRNENWNAKFLRMLLMQAFHAEIHK